MSQNLMLKVAAVWVVVRIVIQVGDIYLGQMFQFTYSQFADYLFNPLSPVSGSLGNPTGIPAVPIDLILICDIIVLLAAARVSMSK